MAFRSLVRRLFHDHRDDIIATLQNERDYLRKQLETAREEVAALANAHAYRLVRRRDEDDEHLSNLLPDAFREKRMIYRPGWALKDKERAFGGGDDETA